MGSSAWEYYILKRIEQSHRWLPSPICLYDTGEHVSLLMSRNEYPSLERVISLHSQAKKAINETIVVFYGIELCHMVAELHQMGIIHGDISPENLLLRHEESSCVLYSLFFAIVIAVTLSFISTLFPVRIHVPF